MPRFRLTVPRCWLLLTLLALALDSAAQAQSTESAIRVIDRVEAVSAAALEPPPASADWQSLDLPWASRIGDAAHSNRVLWLRFDLTRPDRDLLHSLYFYRYNLSIEVYFNGERIGGDSYRPNRQTVAWNHPRLVDIQNANWRPGNNTVHVRFVGSHFGGTFSEVIFGPRDILQPLYEERLFRQVRVNEWLQASGIVVTLLALALWTIRRQDPVYLLFAAATGCWLVLTTHMVVYYNLLDYRYWLPLVHIAIDLFILFLFLFMTRFARLSSPRSEKFLMLWTALAIGWHILAPISYWWVGAYLVHAVGNIFMVTAIIRLSIRALTQRDRLAIAIVLTVLAQLGLGLHDFILTMTGSSEDWESAIYLTQFAFPLLLLVFMIGLLNRFTSALNIAEDLNRNLEAKVEESRRVIEAAYHERRTLELAQATEQERLRIYRDLHDDVGSRLLSIVHAGRDHKLGELARAALQSLRDAVSRANSPEQSLTTFLSGLEEESRLRLEGTGHGVHWSQAGNLPETTLDPETVFNLNQILREVVTNIIRHAAAAEVTFSIAVTETGLRLDVSDDGRGMSPAQCEGNGMSHILQRASELGAAAGWGDRDGGGVHFHLALPLPPASDGVEAHP